VTLLIRRRALIFLLITSVAAVLATSLLAFLSVRGLDAGTPAAGKLLSERVLFAGIVAIIVVVVAGLAVVLRTVHMSRLLDRLVEMNRLTGFSPDTALYRLGDVGQKIVNLYGQLSELSEKKSRKIASLTSLLSYLMDTVKEQILVTDGVSTVVHASRALLERMERPAADVIGVRLDTLLPGADAMSALREMGKTRRQVVRERRGDSLVLTPVYSGNGTVPYMVVQITRGVADELRRAFEAAAAGAQGGGSGLSGGPTRSVRGVLRKIFRSRTSNAGPTPPSRSP